MKITTEQTWSPLWGPEVQEHEPSILFDVLTDPPVKLRAQEIVTIPQLETDFVDDVCIVIQDTVINIVARDVIGPMDESKAMTASIKIPTQIKAEMHYTRVYKHENTAQIRMQMQCTGTTVHVPSHAHELRGEVVLCNKVRSNVVHFIEPKRACMPATIQPPLVRMNAGIVASKYQTGKITPNLRVFTSVAHFIPPAQFEQHTQINLSAGITGVIDYTYTSPLFTHTCKPIIARPGAIYKIPITVHPTKFTSLGIDERR